MQGSSIEIRAFDEADLAQLQRIRDAAFKPVFRSFRDIVGPEIAAIALATAEKEQEDFLIKLCQADTPEKVFVAVLEGRLVGFVAISLDQETKTGEINFNAVHPDFAGQGIGTQLCSFALREMKLAGMKVATVGTGGDQSHAPARRTYEKVGFGPTIPNQWMYKRL